MGRRQESVRVGPDRVEADVAHVRSPASPRLTLSPIPRMTAWDIVVRSSGCRVFRPSLHLLSDRFSQDSTKGRRIRTRMRTTKDTVLVDRRDYAYSRLSATPKASPQEGAARLRYT